MTAATVPAVPRRERILVVAHRHPDFSLGGGEIAAHTLFQAYRRQPGVERAWFLASADRGRGPTGQLAPRREDEYLWEQGTGDWFMLKAAHRRSVTEQFADLLRALRPTVLHAHHYAHLGLEFLRVAKEIDPTIRVVLTLHEYMAICHNQGQMIKTNGRLCLRESFDDCRMCFPQHPPEDFWRRKHFIMRHFDAVDAFVSPSEFLRQRYIAWGIEPGRITVIENGQPAEEPLPPRPLADGAGRSRFGYFGQSTPFKGLDVLLAALGTMTSRERKRVVVEVHTTELEGQPEAWRNKLAALREPLARSGCLQWIGPYQPHELRGRMAGVDWVTMPSIWWENSPLVIQEAFLCGRPLLVSDIGGMAEKVRHDVDGLHVPAANPRAWADALLRAADGEPLWDRLRSGIRRPLSHDACAARHLETALVR